MANTNDIRDAMLRSAPEHADLILDRDAVAERWCAAHGKDKSNLSIEDVLAIRALPEWQRAGS